MSEQEKHALKSHEHHEKDKQLEEIAAERQEALRNRMERHEVAESDHQKESESEALAKAAELAEKADQEKQDLIEKAPEPIHRGAPSKKQLRESFENQLRMVREEMGPIGRTFSKVIHNPVIESVSDFVGSTFARPNALLAGSVTAFIVVTVLYYLAKHYGFQLSGFETIAAFIIGWLIGTLYDYLKNVFHRNR